MAEPQMRAQLHVQAQPSQASLCSPLQRALFTSSHDGKISRDAVAPAIVDVLFYDLEIDHRDAQCLAGFIMDCLSPTDFQPVHEAMAGARSHDLRHEFADLQAAFVAKAIVAALSRLDLADPRRQYLRALLG